MREIADAVKRGETVIEFVGSELGQSGQRMHHERIEINPAMINGKPVIRGTRVPVDLILRELGAGMTIEAILFEYPRLSDEDIRAAQAFAVGRVG